MKCVVCGRVIKGLGNNAEPLASGRCCERCNWTVVMKARIDEAKRNEKGTEK